MEILTAKLNVKLIDKTKLFQGKEALYLDLILIPTPNSQYDDYLIKQSGKKEDDMPIIGGARILKKKEVKEEPEPIEESSDLPF